MRRRNRKAKRKEKKENKKKRETVLREKREEKEKGGKGKGRFLGFRAVDVFTVRVLKLVHAVGSTCGHQKVGVSTNSKR